MMATGASLLLLINLVITVMGGNDIQRDIEAAESDPNRNKLAAKLYSIPVLTIDGEPISMQKYVNKVLIISNIANQCGFAATNYQGLQRIYDILGSTHREHFDILAFPCNQFGGQEPGNPAQIKQHLNSIGVEFSIFQKTEVIGSEGHPLFKNLIAQMNQAPEWNFYKYLVDHKGRVVKVYNASVDAVELFQATRAVVLHKLKVPTDELQLPAEELFSKQEL